MPNKNVEGLLNSYEEHGGINKRHLPKTKNIHLFIDNIKSVLFPGFESELPLEYQDKKAMIEANCQRIKEIGFNAVFRALSWEDRDSTNDIIEKKAQLVIDDFMNGIVELRELLLTDCEAIYELDPAAKNLPEIVLAYPGFRAITIYRIANKLHHLNVPLIPRMMTEIAHSDTGIDIHPAAKIGSHFSIDHGTGVVIGETSVLGHHVKLYQGVTIGALRVDKADTQAKRHPTIEDNVTIYARTTILGGQTMIGKDAIIGGNLWIVRSVPAGSKLYRTSQDHKLR